jgi:hypothetical protein
MDSLTINSEAKDLANVSATRLNANAERPRARLGKNSVRSKLARCPRHHRVHAFLHTLCAHLKACSRIKAINTHKRGSSIGQVNDSGVSIN